MVKYHFAKNEAGEIIDIDDVTVEYRDAHSFYCIGCGAEIGARLGGKNSHHFYHTGGSDCGFGESDLHRYAKKMLRKKFEDNDMFLVRFVQNVSCGVRCRFYKDDEYGGCQKKQLMEYDLKSFGYDTIEEEKDVPEGFIADLLISDSSGRNPAVLLEVYVTHKVGDEKEKSGKRIIEIPIRNEDDLQQYLDKPISEAAPDEYRARALARSPHFYGFKRDALSKSCIDARALPVASMKVDYSIECTKIEDNIRCSEIDNLSCNPDELIKVVFDPDKMYSYRKRLGNFIRMVAIKDGLAVKNCKICRNGIPSMTTGYDHPVRCLIADEYNLEPYPFYWVGVECDHFILSKETIEDFEHREYTYDVYQTVQKWPNGRISYDAFRAAKRLAESDGFVGEDGQVNIRWLASKDNRVLFGATVLVFGENIPEYCIVVDGCEAHWANNDDCSSFAK